MTAGAVISAVQPNSKAERAHLEPGDRLLRVNGAAVADLIDLSFALAEEQEHGQGRIIDRPRRDVDDATAADDQRNAAHDVHHAKRATHF